MKFKQLNFNRTKLTDTEIEQLKRTKNFFKQFTALTTYSIFISILCIVVLSFSLLTDIFHFNTSGFFLINNCRELTMQNFTNGLFIVLNVVYRTFVIYFLLDFLLIVVFAVSSMYQYISIEFDNVVIGDNKPKA